MVLLVDSGKVDNGIKLLVKNSNVLIPSGKDDMEVPLDSGKVDNDMDLPKEYRHLLVPSGKGDTKLPVDSSKGDNNMELLVTNSNLLVPIDKEDMELRANNKNIPLWSRKDYIDNVKQVEKSITKEDSKKGNNNWL